jgi:cytoskeletal protein RodZ
MTKRIQKVFVAVAALGALAVGGSAIATAQQPGQTPAPVQQSAASSEKVGGPDTDTIQSGDQTTPDTVGASASASQTAAGTAETPGTEQSPASEQPGAAEQPGSESAANSDGPGGHADEPGNATADHQFQGAE